MNIVWQCNVLINLNESIITIKLYNFKDNNKNNNTIKIEINTHEIEHKKMFLDEQIIKSLKSVVIVTFG